MQRVENIMLNKTFRHLPQLPLDELQELKTHLAEALLKYFGRLKKRAQKAHLNHRFILRNAGAHEL